MAKAKDDDKLFALLGALLPIVGYVIAVIAKKDTDYAKHYGKQGVVVGIAWIVVWVLSWILFWIPAIGRVIHWILWLIVAILWVIGIVYSLSGEKKDVPVIGEYARKF